MIKCVLCKKWNDWLMEGEGIIDVKKHDLTHKKVAEWVMEVYNSI